ncbi:hypothetical protein IV203_010172 [Nitzschia inconspicua]|uniref:Uncharacterized protein n=1 Tax=Nitzschia inconspicua TaxID=303405 RepID=A0A9K3KWL8_9STRA|nr:hypothetical protein IV203_010172 [Nitzschia inconspicua]
MDGVSIVYMSEVMGKHVWIKFPVTLENGIISFEFIQGLITKYEQYFLDGNPNKPIEHQHWVDFGNNNTGYYNLTEQEDTGYLLWSQEDADAAHKKLKTRPKRNRKTMPASSNVGSTGIVLSPITTRATTNSSQAAVAVTPDQSHKRKLDVRLESAAHRNARAKLEFGSARSNYLDPESNEIN